MQDILNRVVEIAHAAGDEIMRQRAIGVKPEVKKDGSVVTSADRAAEKIIRDGVTPLLPHAAFVGEESVEAGIIPDLSSGDFWCVDPLDGTRNFVENNPYFGVMIALLKSFQPVLGVIWLPLQEILYAGGPGLPNYKIESGKRRDFEKLRNPGQGEIRVLLENRHKNIAHQNQFIVRIPDHQLVATDNPWGFCAIAEGVADIAPFFTKCYEWDSAAQDAILRGVGGNILTADKKPLRYGKTPDFRNPDLLGCRADLAAALPAF